MTDKNRKYRRKNRNCTIERVLSAYPDMHRESARSWVDSVRSAVDEGQTKEYFLGGVGYYPNIPKASKIWDIYISCHTKLGRELM